MLQLRTYVSGAKEDALHVALELEYQFRKVFGVGDICEIVIQQSKRTGGGWSWIRPPVVPLTEKEQAFLDSDAFTEVKEALLMSEEEAEESQLQRGVHELQLFAEAEADALRVHAQPPRALRRRNPITE